MRPEVSGRVVRTLDALGNLPRLLTSTPPNVNGNTVAVHLGVDLWIDVTLEDDGTFTLHRYLAPRPFVKVDGGSLDGVPLCDLREAIEWSGLWPFTFGA